MEFEQGEREDLKEYYDNLIKKKWEIEHSDKKDLFELLGSGDANVFQEHIVSAMKERVVSYEMSDGHNASIVDSGGIVEVSEDDEVFLPFVQHCFMVKVDYKNKDTSLVMHHGPAWQQIPFLIDSCKSKGEISHVNVLWNKEFHQEDLNETIEPFLKNQTGIDIAGQSVSLQGKSLQLLLKGDTGILLEQHLLEESDDPDGPDMEYVLGNQISLK